MGGVPIMGDASVRLILTVASLHTLADPVEAQEWALGTLQMTAVI